MAEDDIYGSKKKYQDVVENISQFAFSPDERKKRWNTKNPGKHYCLNKKNMLLFPRLFKYLDQRPISPARKLRLTGSVKFLLGHTKKTLDEIEKKGDRREIDAIVGAAHREYNPKTASDFIRDLKFLWKLFYPAKDAQGRIDETQKPYVVRHLSPRVDRSTKELRDDRLTTAEYRKILDSFGDDIRVQAFIALMYDSLGRPQEVLNVRIKNVSLFDNYAKIYVRKGKEGPRLLQSIDSYPYITRLLSTHPLRTDPEAFLFLNTGKTNRFKQMTPPNINKKLRERCKLLGIKKSITNYSFKRNGVTDARLRGDTNKSIQKRAGWTTTKQLETYDIAGEDESFTEDLIRRGIIKPDESTQHIAPISKMCPHCDAINPISERTCVRCTHLLYREDIEAEQQQQATAQQQRDSEIITLREQMRLIAIGLHEIKKDKQPRGRPRTRPGILDFVNVPLGTPEHEKAILAGRTHEELQRQAEEFHENEMQLLHRRKK
jgi:integrase